MWRFARARAAGSSHVRAGLPCQDQIGCVARPEGTLIAAVADGAGSAERSDLGAEIAVEAVLEVVAEALEAGRTDFADVLLAAALEARDRLAATARQQALEVRHLASTLLAAVVGPAGGAALQIGDGVIVVNDGGAGWSWVVWPQRGEYVNTTRFLTEEAAPEILQVEPLPPSVTDLALTTDGLEPLALHYASTSVHEPFFAGIFRPLLRADGTGEIASVSGALESFLSSDRVASRTDDDVSLVLATRRDKLPEL